MQITHLCRTRGNVRHTLPYEAMWLAWWAICVAPYTWCDANSWRFASFLHPTQIIDRSFASRPVPSDRSPTQIGVSGPTQINPFLLVLVERSVDVVSGTFSINYVLVKPLFDYGRLIRLFRCLPLRVWGW